MAKIEAENCKNFQGTDVVSPDEQKIIHICTTPYCVDRVDCDGERIEEIRDAHFEPIVPPPGSDEIIHTF